MCATESGNAKLDFSPRKKGLYSRSLTLTSSGFGFILPPGVMSFPMEVKNSSPSSFRPGPGALVADWAGAFMVGLASVGLALMGAGASMVGLALLTSSPLS